ncbi:MAG: N-acetylmuramoyl-L-alanine amidase [Pseudobdellovibrionaceae bacterium]
MILPRLLLALALLGTMLCYAIPAHALDVTSVRTGKHPDKERIVIELSQAPESYRAFLLENPQRVVLDMDHFNWKTKGVSKPEGSFLRDVRYGELDQKRSRLVMETSSPVMILSAFPIPRQKGQPDRFVIDIAPSTARDSSPQQILGTMQSSAALTLASAPVAASAGIPVPLRRPNYTSPQDAPRPHAQKPLIIIDPGHGGPDPGAIGANGMYEKTIVLAVGLELKRQLEASGLYRVKMTRDRDIFIPLRDRVKFSRKNQGDLFISLHADSIRNSHVAGASVYTLSEVASDKETEKLADRENKSDLIAGIDLSHQEDDVAGILIDLAARDTMNQSRFLARTVLTTFNRNGVKTIDNTARSAGFAVLKAVDIPSILVEMGYLTNRSEVERLSTPAYRQRVALAVKASVDSYFQKIYE